MKKLTYNQLSHAGFLEKLSLQVPNWKKFYSIESEYVNSKTKIVVRDKYGFCSMQSMSLLSGSIPSILSAINKLEYFKSRLLEKFPKYRNYYKVLWYTSSSKVYCQDTVGLYCITSASLLSSGNLSPVALIHKSEHFYNNLAPILTTKFKVLKLPKKVRGRLLIEDSYGILSINYEHFLNGRLPTIKSAIDKTKYIVNRFIEIHGDKYDYSKVRYAEATKNVTIVCKNHGPFQQTPRAHLVGKGCNNCSLDYTGYANWVPGCKANPNAIPILYVVRCWNGDEEFYKVGRTYTQVKGRYGVSKNITVAMPYIYETIQEVFGSCEQVFTWECLLHRELKKLGFHYSPKLPFGGSVKECYKI